LNHWPPQVGDIIHVRSEHFASNESSRRLLRWNSQICGSNYIENGFVDANDALFVLDYEINQFAPELDIYNIKVLLLCNNVVGWLRGVREPYVSVVAR
jgi:hypothetical protein